MQSLLVKLAISLVLFSTCLAAQQGTPIQGPVDDMYFVVIPAGTLNMGSPNSEVGRSDSEGPRHTVTLACFEIMTTEITQGMWQDVMGTSVEDLRALSDHVASYARQYDAIGSDIPMYYLNYHDCIDFVDNLNSIDTTYVYRLPTESEWEYACRAGTSTPFYWGYETSISTLSDYCWCSRTANNRNAHAVASLMPNAWGLYDMSGNVWEWCEDWWNDSYANWSGAPVNGSAWTEGNFGHLRILRGGGTANEAINCRSAQRHAMESTERHNTIGFRLVREPASAVNAERLLQEAYSSLVSENYDEAITSIEEAIQLVPNDKTTYAFLGYAYILSGRFEDAVPPISTAIELDSEYYEAYHLRGNAYAYTGLFDQALSDYEYCLSNAPDMKVYTLYSMACVYGLMGDSSLSIDYLEQAVEAGFNDLDHIENDPDFEMVMGSSEFQEGLERIRSVI